MHGSTSDGVNLRINTLDYYSHCNTNQCLRRIFLQESRREESMKIDNSGAARVSQSLEDMMAWLPRDISESVLCQISVNAWLLVKVLVTVT